MSSFAKQPLWFWYALKTAAFLPYAQLVQAGSAIDCTRFGDHRLVRPSFFARPC